MQYDLKDLSQLKKAAAKELENLKRMANRHPYKCFKSILSSVGPALTPKGHVFSNFIVDMSPQYTSGMSVLDGDIDKKFVTLLGAEIDESNENSNTTASSSRATAAIAVLLKVCKTVDPELVKQIRASLTEYSFPEDGEDGLEELESPGNHKDRSFPLSSFYFCKEFISELFAQEYLEDFEDMDDEDPSNGAVFVNEHEDICDLAADDLPPKVLAGEFVLAFKPGANEKIREWLDSNYVGEPDLVIGGPLSVLGLNVPSVDNEGQEDFKAVTYDHWSAILAAYTIEFGEVPIIGYRGLRAASGNGIFLKEDPKSEDYCGLYTLYSVSFDDYNNMEWNHRSLDQMLQESGDEINVNGGSLSLIFDYLEQKLAKKEDRTVMPIYVSAYERLARGLSNA